MRLPHLSISFDYVLILEWLNKEDRRTGEEMHEFLQKLGVPTCLVRCKSADHVRAALERAVQNIPVRRVPLVHIESHGSNPFDEVDVRDTVFGINAAPGLPWTELGAWLAPLNAASEFRLLLVGATCFGFAAIAAMTVGEHVAPFAATVGFTTTAGEGSLHDAMKEFYRSICQRREKLEDAVAAAKRELRDPNTKVRATSSLVLAIRILRGVYDNIQPGEPLTAHANELVGKLREAGLPVPAQIGDALPSVLLERGRARLKEAWDNWFPPAAQLEQAYHLDWDWIERIDLDAC
jgi:hypothetical protein